MKSNALAAAFAVALFASTATASSVTVSYQVDGNPYGAQNYSERVHIKSPGASGVLWAGQFELTGDGGFGDFKAFCVDIFENLRDEKRYEAPAIIHGRSITDNIDRLFTSAFDLVTDGLTAAAFQLSIWEVIYDDGGPLSLKTGNFQTVQSNGRVHNKAVQAQAEAFLSDLPTADMGAYGLTFLYNDGSQDLVMASPAVASVPLPGSSVLLLGALGALCALHRRKTV